MRLTGAPHPATDPQLDADPLETAERLAVDCAGETFSWFRSEYFDVLSQLSPATLAVLSAELYLRLSNDQGRFCLMLSHEMRLPEDQRRTPEQLLQEMTMHGFRPAPSMARRRAEAAFLREMEAPPQSWIEEQAQRLAHLRREVRRVLAARGRMLETGQDPVRREHVPLLLALDAGDDLDEEALAEIEELCSMRYSWLAKPDFDASPLSATQTPERLN